MSIGLNPDKAGGRGWVTVDGNNSSEIGQNYIKLPMGTTGERPATAYDGYTRYNTSNNNIEQYSKGNWYKLSDQIANITNLVSYYPLTSASYVNGAYQDYAGGYHLTKYGTAITNVTDARFGSVIDFTNPGNATSNDYLRASSWKNISGSSGVSVSFWMNTTYGTYTNDMNQWVVSEGATNTSWEVFSEGSGTKFRMGDAAVGYNASLDCSVPITTTLTGSWKHIVATFNNTSKLQSLYVDGVLKTTITGDRAGNYTGSYILVGQHSSLLGTSVSYRYRGKLCALRIYDKVLTTGDVQTLYGEF